MSPIPVPNRPAPSYTTSHYPTRAHRARRRVDIVAENSSALQVRGAVALAPRPAFPRVPITRMRARSATPAQVETAYASPIIAFPERRRPYPKGLRLLILAQRSSFICASAITAIALTLYGWTVYSQQRWSQQYSYFRLLQHHEQQLMTVKGTLDAQVFESRDSADEVTSALQPISPSDVVHLPSAPLRPAALDAQPSAQQVWTIPQPIGY